MNQRFGRVPARRICRSTCSVVVGEKLRSQKLVELVEIIEEGVEYEDGKETEGGCGVRNGEAHEVDAWPDKRRVKNVLTFKIFLVKLQH